MSGDRESFILAEGGKPCGVFVSEADYPAAVRAARLFAGDLEALTGSPPVLAVGGFQGAAPVLRGPRAVIAGTLGRGGLIDALAETGRIAAERIRGGRERYLRAVVQGPLPGPLSDLSSALVIAGSDRRGTVYGLLDLSAELGVSPWAWWADVPVRRRTDKEGIRVLNKWYNDGLIWKDFPLYPIGDKTMENLMKAGYVGAFIGNWDFPYRDGDNSIQLSMKKMQGADAAFIAVDCFKNDAGKYRKYLGATTSDRKIFFPATNDEPVASLLYLNWLAKLDNRKFLQIGEEGVTHQKNPDGSIKMIAVKGEKIMNSPNNIDYTIVLNGLDLGDAKLTAKSLAMSYAGIDPRYIEKSYLTQRTDGRVAKVFNVGKIASEEGMGPVETEKRNNMLTQAVVAKTKDFDKVYDAGLKDILASGVQAIIDERRAKLAAMK